MLVECAPEKAVSCARERLRVLLGELLNRLELAARNVGNEAMRANRIGRPSRTVRLWFWRTASVLLSNNSSSEGENLAYFGTDLHSTVRADPGIFLSRSSKLLISIDLD